MTLFLCVLSHSQHTIPSLFMDSIPKLLFTALLILAAAIQGVRSDAFITGTVFCDQCKDSQLSLFDYPLYGAKVSVACPGSNGEVTTRQEDTTNWFGNFAMRIAGTPDLSGCYAQISSNEQNGNMGCGAIAGRPRNLRQTFRLFDMEFFVVDIMFSEPAQPALFCPRSSNPVPTPNPVTAPSFPPIFNFPPFNPVPTPVAPTKPPPVQLPPSPPPFRLPPIPWLPPPVQLPPPLPPFRFPPIPWMPPRAQLPPLPPLPQLPPMPPFPFVEASACSHENWTMPEHRCYWRAVSPDTKVALVFGAVAARRYGTNMTLYEGLQGRGDPYRTLLREGVTAFLNSYNSLQFQYNTVDVVLHLNSAITGSPRNVLVTALRFKRANYGSANITCRFTDCK